MLYRRRAFENYEFEYRQNNHNSWTFRLFRLTMNAVLIEQKSKNFKWKTLLQKKSYQLQPCWKNWNQSLWKNFFKKDWQDLPKLSSFSRIFGQSRFRRKDQLPTFCFEQSSSSREVWLESLMEEFKQVVIENYDFRNNFGEQFHSFRIDKFRRQNSTYWGNDFLFVISYGGWKTHSYQMFLFCFALKIFRFSKYLIPCPSFIDFHEPSRKILLKCVVRLRWLNDSCFVFWLQQKLVVSNLMNF